MPAGLTRDEKVENLVMNFSMIMMGMFEGAFTALAAGMAEAMEGAADAMAEALDGKKPARRGRGDAKAEVERNVKVVFAKLRDEAYSNIDGKEEEFRRFIKDRSFDEGVKIVESHDLHRPRLTERLTDSDLEG
ncbi:MAG TPA: hypothetical protein VJR06_04045, partial [Nitrososphaerales archaeon]|nr:hypothetical protein [Nitrososphaerales archaeon]